MQLTETFFDLIFLVAARSLRSLDCRRQYPAAELTHQRFILCTGSFPAVRPALGGHSIGFSRNT
jgi:hypothetical protein